ncbi:MAG: hypothetical protein ABSE76_01585 [Minisyncoccia bacterium]|jgi:hypothetical protein
MNDEYETEGFLLSESDPDDEDTDDTEGDGAELEEEEEETSGVIGLDGEEE